MRWATSDHAPSPPNNSAAEDRTEVTLGGDEPRVLPEEQASLRRLAMLVAQGVAPESVFAAVTEEVGRLLSVDYALVGRYEPDGAVTFLAAAGRTDRVLPAGTRLKLGGKNVSTLVFETRRPARTDSYADASGPSAVAALERGACSSVGTPIIVERSLWGVMVVGSSGEPPLPSETEARLASFTGLVATAVANAESRAELARLAEEQAALRRVATLVARGIPPAELFAAVTEEVGHVLHVDAAAMARYESDDTMTAVAISSRTGDTSAAIGSRHRLGGQTVSTLVFETGRPARIDTYAGDASGSIADEIRTMGVRSAVGAPISVEGRLWGVIHAASTREQPLPADTETRLVSFTELVATAIANAETRAGLTRLAEEQAALRRVATLAARGIAPEKLFAAVSEEAGQLLGAHLAGMARYNSDETVTVLATWAAEGEHPLVPGPWPLGGGDLASEIWRTGQPVRIADYRAVRGRIASFVREELGIGSSVGSPIVVGGRLWGALFVHGRQNHPPPPPETESRLTSFADLVATAVANAESRAGLARLSDEQAALRRVATLVARGVPPEEVFAAVNEEVVRLLPVDFAHMGRYEGDGTATVVAASGSTVDHFRVGRRWSLGGMNLATIVFETGRPARLDYDDASGPLGLTARDLGIRSSVATPIIVEGRVWGGVFTGSTVMKSLPADLEARLGSFTELVATAVANAESRAALAASRARIVAAADESRRRIERDLHDGAQQRLVHAVIVLKLALRALSNGEPNADELVAEALRQTEHANAELRELAHGILPAALTRGGLRAGIDALVSRVSLPVSVDVSVERLPAAVEATAYFIISEALTNVVKHARAAGARVTARVERGELRVEVRDDGIGGARGGESTGLGGLADRVSALAGRLELESPPGAGTRVCALLPVSGQG
jgi:GAF domain-containing protein